MREGAIITSPMSIALLPLDTGTIVVQECSAPELVSKTITGKLARIISVQNGDYTIHECGEHDVTWRKADTAESIIDACKTLATLHGYEYTEALNPPIENRPDEGETTPVKDSERSRRIEIAPGARGGFIFDSFRHLPFQVRTLTNEFYRVRNDPPDHDPSQQSLLIEYLASDTTEWIELERVQNATVDDLDSVIQSLARYAGMTTVQPASSDAMIDAIKATDTVDISSGAILNILDEQDETAAGETSTSAADPDDDPDSHPL